MLSLRLFVLLVLSLTWVKGMAAVPKIHLIGASVTAGFCAHEPLGGPQSHHYPLRHYLDAALITEHEPVQSSAQTGLFLSVDFITSKEIEAAIAAAPDVTVGIDFLFWFCYGRMAEDQRLPKLEAGLALLDKLKSPLIVGDIPDASAAAGGMLAHEQVPELETINAANKRIKEWAVKKPAVTVLPMAAFMAAATADEEIKAGPVVFPAGKSRALLQKDMLHASRHGCAALALVILDTMVQRKLLPRECVKWDPEVVYTSGIQLADKELKAQAEQKKKKAA